MTKLLRLFVVAAVSLAAFPAWAHDLLVVNHTDQDIVFISAKPGEVEDFKRVHKGRNGKFNIKLPSGQCTTLITIRLRDGQTVQSTEEVCGGLKYTVSARPRGH